MDANRGNIIDIFAGLKKTDGNKKTLSQYQAQEPIIVRVESVTAKFCLNRSLWRTISNMCTFYLRDQLAAIGIKSDDWYLSEDQSLVLMADQKDFPHIRDSLTALLLKLHKDSLALQATIHIDDDEETSAHSTSSSFPP